MEYGYAKKWKMHPEKFKRLRNEYDGSPTLKTTPSKKGRLSKLLGKRAKN